MGFLNKLFGKSEDEMTEEFSNIAKVNDARLQEIQSTSNQIAGALHDMNESSQRSAQRLSNMDNLIGRLDKVVNTARPRHETRVSSYAMSLLDGLPSKGLRSVNSCLGIDIVNSKDRKVLTSHQDYSKVDPNSYANSPLNWVKRYEFKPLEVLSGADELKYEEFLKLHLAYAKRHKVDLNRPLAHLLHPDDLAVIRQKLEEHYTYKQPQCDAYDYMIAATSGLLGGLIDIFLVASPQTGALTKWADDTTDSAICGFARLCGWQGPRAGSDETSSAIQFLERTFPVNYDQKFGAETGGVVNMRPSDHHLKSLGHSPDLLGLFFSILDQFTNQAHFIADGQIVSMDTENFELHGSTLLGKLFCGTANWLGHIISDIGGSSGSALRGTGVPIPFYNLLQLADFGSFGPDQKTIAQISTQVFSKGYDFRHGIAMSIPVIFTELTIRLMYVLKALFIKQPYPKCSGVGKISFEDSPYTSHLPYEPEKGEGMRWWKKLDVSRGLDSSVELQRMLTVGHGILCMMDAGDALVCGKGNLVNTLLRFNLIAWVRFSFLACKEMKNLVLSGHIDNDRLDRDLDLEYQKMLLALKG